MTDFLRKIIRLRNENNFYELSFEEMIYKNARNFYDTFTCAIVF